MYLAGLTGGIGSGKSTVAARLVGLGAHVVDADAVAREVVEPGTPGLAELAATFGPEVVTADGALDRQALADLVFADVARRAELNRITHPRIASRIAELVAGHAAAERDEPAPRVVVVDHPLLVETGQAADFPAVIVVVAPSRTRVARLVEQRGMDPADARARLAAQASDDERRAVATHVIDNGGSLDELHAQVDAVYEQLRTAAAASA